MNKIIFVIPLVILALLPILNGVSKEMLAGAQWAFASNCCFYPSNGDNPKADNAFEAGLDSGTIMAENGDAPPEYQDCIGDGGNQAQYQNYVNDFCSGLLQGYQAFGK